jgi:hypothetical protein
MVCKKSNSITLNNYGKKTMQYKLMPDCTEWKLDHFLVFLIYLCIPAAIPIVI